MQGRTDNGPRHKLAGLWPVHLKIRRTVGAHTPCSCLCYGKHHHFWALHDLGCLVWRCTYVSSFLALPVAQLVAYRTEDLRVRVHWFDSPMAYLFPISVGGKGASYCDRIISSFFFCQQWLCGKAGCSF